MTDQGAPNLFKADELRNWNTAKKNSDGRWVAARPLGWQGLRLWYRLKLCWGVFTAKYDVVQWDESYYENKGNSEKRKAGAEVSS